MNFYEYEETDWKIGDKVWICDYRFKNAIIDKPSHKIIPTQAIMCSNSELHMCNKENYYAFHFKKIGKGGKVLASKIGPYIKEGYRWPEIIPPNIFLTPEECYTYFTDICTKLEDRCKVEMKKVAKEYDDKLLEIIKYRNKYSIKRG